MARRVKPGDGYGTSSKWDKVLIYIGSTGTWQGLVVELEVQLAATCDSRLSWTEERDEMLTTPNVLHILFSNILIHNVIRLNNAVTIPIVHCLSYGDC